MKRVIYHLLPNSTVFECPMKPINENKIDVPAKFIRIQPAHESNEYLFILTILTCKFSMLNYTCMPLLYFVHFMLDVK